ncbi:hypothetical protein K440DRAFT_664250 [Wilcoxina mikolae CBS 423.85]|nr:hypothetical protein K440DRAFT_664250 [Wilcoxina mikolae CBS 423.85]
MSLPPLHSDNHPLDPQQHPKPDFRIPKTPMTFNEWPPRSKPDFYMPLPRSEALTSTACGGSGGGILDKQHCKPDFGIPTQMSEAHNAWSTDYLRYTEHTIPETCHQFVYKDNLEEPPLKPLTKGLIKFILALTFVPIVATVWVLRTIWKGIKYEQAQRKAKAAREIAERPPFWEAAKELDDTDSLKDSKSQDMISKEVGLDPLERLHLESETGRSDAIQMLKLCGLDGADDTDIESTGDDDRGCSFRATKSTASAEATRIQSVRAVDCVWPGSLSPRFRSYRSLPRSLSQSSLEMSPFDGSGSSTQRNEVHWTPLASLKSSKTGGINEPSLNTAEVLVDVAGPIPRRHVAGPRRTISRASLKGFGIAGSDLGTPPPAEDSPRDTTPFAPDTPSVGPGLVAPPPTDESTEPSPIVTEREPPAVNASTDSHHPTSSNTESYHSFPFPFQTASPATNKYHSGTREPSTEVSVPSPDLEPQIELHNPAPVVEVTIEDRDDPPIPENSGSRTLTPEVQVQLDLLLLQVVNAVKGLVLLAARQENARDLLLMFVVAGLRFWQWFLIAMAGQVRNKLIDADGKAKEDEK